MTTLRISELPPSVNNLFFNVPRRGRVKTPAYRAWLDLAGQELRLLQRAPHHSGDVAVEIAAQELRHRGRDLDNLCKPILDALVTFRVIDDDRHVRRLEVAWAEVKGVEIQVRAI